MRLQESGLRQTPEQTIPMPEVDSTAELDQRLAAASVKDAHRRIDNRARTVGHDAGW